MGASTVLEENVLFQLMEDTLCDPYFNTQNDQKRGKQNDIKSASSCYFRCFIDDQIDFANTILCPKHLKS